MREEVSETTIELTREVLLGDVRDMALQWIKSAVAWQAFGEKQQREIIDAVTKGAAGVVARMAEIMAADGRDAIPVTLESIAIKDGMKVTLKVPLTEENVTALAITGGALHLVRKSSASYEGTRGPVYPDPDQGGLPFNGPKPDGAVAGE